MKRYILYTTEYTTHMLCPQKQIECWMVNSEYRNHHIEICRKPKWTIFHDDCFGKCIYLGWKFMAKFHMTINIVSNRCGTIGVTEYRIVQQRDTRNNHSTSFSSEWQSIKDEKLFFCFSSLLWSCMAAWHVWIWTRRQTVRRNMHWEGCKDVWCYCKTNQEENKCI